MSGTTDARRFATACGIGGAGAMGVLTWFALRGTTALLARQPVSNFYEAQGRALFHGHWDVGPDALSFERFKVGGRFYAYFGPWPALLRMPIMLVTDRFDGRMSRVSVLLACAVLLVAVARLSWLACRHHRGDVALGRRELLVAGAFTFVAGCGSLVVYLASWPAVYHEAIAWGVAWTVASMGCLFAHLLDRRPLQLGLASLFATFAVLSRASVGLGAVAALALVLAAHVVRLARQRRLPRDRRTTLLVACVAVPLLLHGYVNVVKFGSPVGVPPIAKQDLLTHWPPRAPALAANDGSLFGPVYTPTILLQYLRPDAIAVTDAFPWVGFAKAPHVLGGAVFEARNPSTGIPATSTLLVLLAGAGTVVALRRRHWHLVVLVVGGAVGSVGALSLAFIDQRYQGDLLPVLLVPAPFGLWWLVTTAPRWRVAARVTAGAALVVTGAWSCWANSALALVYQRGTYPYVSTADRASLVRLQLAVDDRLGRRPTHVTEGDAPGAADPAQALFVQGDCAQVLWSDGSEWHPVETTAATGHIRARVTAMPPSGERRALVSVADGRGTASVTAIGRPHDRVALEYRWRPFAGVDEAPATLRGAGVDAPRGATTLDVRLDRRGRFSSVVSVALGGRTVLDGDATLSLGAPTYGPDVARLPVATPICDRLVRLGAVRRTQ